MSYAMTSESKKSDRTVRAADLVLRPIVVVTAGIVIGLLCGLPLYLPESAAAALPSGEKPPEGIINLLGRAFAEKRLMTLFLITLPAVGLSEKYGLRERARQIIENKDATPGRLSIAYQLFRVIVGALGVRLNGHPLFVRPVIVPMALKKAGLSERNDLTTDTKDRIKAACAAAENYGNFYGQNLSPVQPGILLVYSVMKDLGCEISVWRLILSTVPIVTLSILLGCLQFRKLDRELSGKAALR